MRKKEPTPAVHQSSSRTNARKSRPLPYKSNTNMASVVEEPVAAWFAVAAGAVLQLAQHPRALNQLTPLEKSDLVKQGISKKDLEHLKKTANLDYDQLSQALAVTRATLINKKGKAKFSLSISEKIISLADIYAFGYEVFEEVALFNAWVFRPNRALGGLTPFSLLDNQYGREEIKNLIGRIAYGVYS
jgi:putative toxin-antitoxin system antitoxin component (TIGR02293 family)